MWPASVTGKPSRGTHELQQPLYRERHRPDGRLVPQHHAVGQHHPGVADQRQRDAQLRGADHERHGHLWWSGVADAAGQSGVGGPGCADPQRGGDVLHGGRLRRRCDRRGGPERGEVHLHHDEPRRGRYVGRGGFRGGFFCGGRWEPGRLRSDGDRLDAEHRTPGVDVLVELHGRGCRSSQDICVDRRGGDADPVFDWNAGRQLVHVAAQRRDGNPDGVSVWWRPDQLVCLDCFAAG